MTATTALTLYQIEDHLAALIDSVDMVPDDEPGLLAELEEDIARTLELELKKVDGVSHMLAHFESQAQFAAAEIKRLQASKKRYERAGERLEAYVRGAMQLAGRDKLEGETSTLQIRKNPAAVYISNCDAIPAEYQVISTSVSVDKARVSKALKAGVVVPGAELVQGERLERR
jgi:hypothetical protein